MPFTSPNYTQTPNELFDELMQDMGYAELKVTLAVIRLTFGFHREGYEIKATLSQMQQMTGLSRPAILAGAKAAEERGIVEKRFSETGELLWMVKLLYRDSKATLPPTYRGNKKKETRASREEVPVMPNPITHPNLYWTDDDLAAWGVSR
jgi:hypothetical protein